MTVFPKSDLNPPVMRQRAEWSDLRVFWAVAQAGSFGAASRALGVTTSALVKRMDALEGRLGAKLLMRSKHGVSLTEAGERVFDHALTMEREAIRIEKLVLDDDRRHEGVVTLALPDGIAGFTVAPRIGEFLAVNPQIRLVLDCDFDVERPLESADIALQFDEPADPELATELLAHVHYCVFASREYVETYGMPASLREAAAHRYVHHTGQRRQRQNWRHNMEYFQGLQEFSVVTNSSTVSLYAAQGGAGMAALPSRAIVRAPELLVLNPAPVATMKLWMRYRQEDARVTRVKRVLEWLREVFDARENPWFRPEFVHPDAFRPTPVPAAEPAPVPITSAPKRRKAS